MIRYDKNASVSILSGVGKSRQAQLSRLGVETLSDLIYLFPRAYERRGNVKLLSEISPDVDEAVILTVKSTVKTAEAVSALSLKRRWNTSLQL